MTFMLFIGEVLSRPLVSVGECFSDSMEMTAHLKFAMLFSASLKYGRRAVTSRAVCIVVTDWNENAKH